VIAPSQSSRTKAGFYIFST